MALCQVILLILEPNFVTETEAIILIMMSSGSRTETPSPVSSSESREPGPSGASIETGDEARYEAVMKPLQYDSLEFASECNTAIIIIEKISMSSL